MILKLIWWTWFKSTKTLALLIFSISNTNTKRSSFALIIAGPKAQALQTRPHTHASLSPIDYLHCRHFISTNQIRLIWQSGTLTRITEHSTELNNLYCLTTVLLSMCFIICIKFAISIIYRYFSVYLSNQKWTLFDHHWLYLWPTVNWFLSIFFICLFI